MQIKSRVNATVWYVGKLCKSYRSLSHFRQNKIQYSLVNPSRAIDRYIRPGFFLRVYIIFEISIRVDTVNCLFSGRAGTEIGLPLLFVTTAIQIYELDTKFNLIFIYYIHRVQCLVITYLPGLDCRDCTVHCTSIIK